MTRALMTASTGPRQTHMESNHRSRIESVGPLGLASINDGLPGPTGPGYQKFRPVGPGKDSKIALKNAIFESITWVKSALLAIFPRLVGPGNKSRSTEKHRIIEPETQTKIVVFSIFPRLVGPVHRRLPNSADPSIVTRTTDWARLAR